MLMGYHALKPSVSGALSLAEADGAERQELQRQRRIASNVAVKPVQSHLIVVHFLYGGRQVTSTTLIVSTSYYKAVLERLHLRCVPA
jgi:hypothetical protein